MDSSRISKKPSSLVTGSVTSAAMANPPRGAGSPRCGGRTGPLIRIVDTDFRASNGWLSRAGRDRCPGPPGQASHGPPILTFRSAAAYPVGTNQGRRGAAAVRAAQTVEQRTWPALNEHDHAPEAGADPPAGRPPGRPERADSDPDFFRLQWEAAEAMAAEERWQDAARLWERLLSQKRRLPPGDAARVQRRLAAAYVHLALQRKPLEGSRRNALQAVGLLEKAAALDDRQPAPLYWCGVIYRWFGLWEKAADFFRRALEIDPAHLPSRLELGWTLLRLGELDQVRALL